MKLVLLSLAFVFISCNNGASTPEGLIQKFVKDSIAGKADKDYYAEYTTGALLAASVDLSDEELDGSSLGSLSDVDVDILTKNCEEDKCIVTYIIKYKTESNGKKAFETEVKKIAEVVKEGEFWKLSDVKNIKTFHESKEPINPLEEKK